MLELQDVLGVRLMTYDTEVSCSKCGEYVEVSIDGLPWRRGRDAELDIEVTCPACRKKEEEKP